MKTAEDLPEIDYLELAIICHRERIAKNIERARHWIARDVENGKRKFVTPGYLKRNTRIISSYNDSDFARDLTPEHQKILDKISEEANDGV